MKRQFLPSPYRQRSQTRDRVGLLKTGNIEGSAPTLPLKNGSIQKGSCMKISLKQKVLHPGGSYEVHSIQLGLRKQVLTIQLPIIYWSSLGGVTYLGSPIAIPIFVLVFISPRKRKAARKQQQQQTNKL